MDIFTTRGVSLDILPESTDGYWTLLNKYLVHNGKITDAFNSVWEILDVYGYYRGGTDVDVVKTGFNRAKLIIETLSKIRPKR
jgi:hypothetical protein